MRLLIRDPKQQKTVVNGRVFHNRNTLFHLAELHVERPARTALPPPEPHPVRPRPREASATPFPPSSSRSTASTRRRSQAVAALKARLTEAELEKRKAEGELADHKEKLKKYQAQLRNVQSSREYCAALNEIDGVEKLIRSTEDRFLELEEEIEKARADLDEREKTLPAETEQHEERLKDWRAEQRAINEELASAREEIARLEAEIPPRDRAEFRRLIDKKHGLAVVLVSGQLLLRLPRQGPPGRDADPEAGPRDHLLRQLQADPLLRAGELVGSRERHALSSLHRRRRARQPGSGRSRRLRRGRGRRSPPRSTSRRSATRPTTSPSTARCCSRCGAPRSARPPRSRSPPTACSSSSRSLGRFKVKAPHLKPLIAEALARAKALPPLLDRARAAAKTTRRPTAWPTSAPTRASATSPARSSSSSRDARPVEEIARRRAESSRAIARAAERRAAATRRRRAHGGDEGPRRRDRRQRRAGRADALRREPGPGRGREDRGPAAPISRA